MDNQPQPRMPKGLILRQARESKGLTLEMVHEATKIPMDALRAIEEGYTVRTLSTFYYRGFLKMYAKFLGVNVTEVVDDYKPEKLPEQITDKKEEEVSERSIFLFTPELKNRIIKILVGILVFLFLVKVTGCFIHKMYHKAKKLDAQSIHFDNKKKQVRTKITIASEKGKIAEETLPLKQPVVVSNNSTDNPSSTPEEKKGIDLVIRAKKDNWLQVKVDDEVVFRSTLKRGAVETWHADKMIELSGKDIGDSEFELNGKMMGPLGRENRRAKKIIIDHNGFSVKQ